jgi:hypothetical protein
MVALLLVDIGLAAAGGVLMSKGLAEREAKKVEPTPVEKKSEAPAGGAATASDKVAAGAQVPAATAASASAAAPASATGTASAAASATAAAPASARAAAPASASGAASATQPATTAVAARESPKRAGEVVTTKPGVTATKPTDTKSTTKPTDPKKAKPTDTKSTANPTAAKPTDKPDVAKPVGSVPTTPQDPYLAPNTEREIDAAAASSKAAFARCAADHPAQGALKIAFQVRGDGRVINASAVENSTGNAELARCVSAEVSTWRVSAHDGAAINMLRPFTYP